MSTSLYYTYSNLTSSTSCSCSSSSSSCSSSASFSSCSCSCSSSPHTHRSSYSSSSTVKGGYSSHSRKRDSSADSGKGYSKAATPDGTLDSSMTTFTYGGER